MIPSVEPAATCAVETAPDRLAARAHGFQNAVDSALLLAGLGLLLAVAGVLLLGAHAVGWAAIAVGLTLVLAPRLPASALMTIYRAQRIEVSAGGTLTVLVGQLAERGGLASAPELFVIPSLTLSAFATGHPDRAAIGITEGLLRRLTMREIAGVLAHEIGHIGVNDLGVMAIADVTTRLAQALAYVATLLTAMNLYASLLSEAHMSWLAISLLYLAPSLASVLQISLSRAREFAADAEAARLTGDPLGLASALRRLEPTTGRFWEDLMLPVPARKIAYPSLLRSHPPTEDRVRRLIEISSEPVAATPLEPLMTSEQPLISLVGFGPGEMRPRYRFPGFWF